MVIPDANQPPAGAEGTSLQLHGVFYLNFLRQLQMHLSPQSYLEVGTNEGASLAHVTCDSVAVDPHFTISQDVLSNKRRALFFQMTSDTFFRDYDVRAFFPGGVDLAFLDGMHRIEYLLRDFMNVEAAAHPRSLILIHDCLPLNFRMAHRTFNAGPAEEGANANAWVGDVWKILPILKQYRPDLRVMLFDCPPTGLVAVSRLDPDSKVLDKNYHAILDTFGPTSIEEYGIARLWAECPLTDSNSLVANPDKMTVLLSVC